MEAEAESQFKTDLNRFEKLNDQQVLGAHFALRLIRTSPRIRGAALEMLDAQIDDCEQVMVDRGHWKRTDDAES